MTFAPLGRMLPLPKSLRPLADLAPRWRHRGGAPERTEAVGEPVARVGLLAGCVQRVLFGDVNAATVRVLAAHGCEVIVPRGQGCCGALAVHAGRQADGLERARRTIAAFERAGVDLVVSNAAGCGSNLKDYRHLLADDAAYAERAAAFSAKVRDVSEVLVDLEPRSEPAPLPLRVAFQDSCHLAHAQALRGPPRAMLAGVPGLELAEPADQDICCGSAGIFNLVQPEAARELGERKAARVLEVEPAAYVAANPGCLVQVSAALRRAGKPCLRSTPVELLDASLRGIEPGELLAQARR